MQTDLWPEPWPQEKLERFAEVRAILDRTAESLIEQHGLELVKAAALRLSTALRVQDIHDERARYKAAKAAGDSPDITV